MKEKETEEEKVKEMQEELEEEVEEEVEEEKGGALLPGCTLAAREYPGREVSCDRSTKLERASRSWLARRTLGAARE